MSKQSTTPKSTEIKVEAAPKPTEGQSPKPDADVAAPASPEPAGPAPEEPVRLTMRRRLELETRYPGKTPVETGELKPNGEPHIRLVSKAGLLHLLKQEEEGGDA